jgi:dihydrodipicolinate synthase/N-acetylneuraminate lyase
MLERLLQLPNIAEFKLTASDPCEFASVISEYSDRCIILSRVDVLFAPALLMCAQDAVGTFISNLVPKWFVELYDWPVSTAGKKHKLSETHHTFRPDC